MTNIELAPVMEDETLVERRTRVLTMRNAGATMGHAPDGLDARREEAGRTLAELADRVAELAPLDARWVLPLGYTVSASTRVA